MKPIFILIAALVVATFAAPVAAQDGNVSVGVQGETETCDRYITEYISLCSADYDDGVAILVLEGDRRERVTITEAVALTEPGELNRESFIVDGRTEIRFAVSPSNGAAGVTIDDGSTLYGLPLEASEPLIAGPFTASDAQAAGLGGALSVSVFTLFLVLRAARGESDGGERIA